MTPQFITVALGRKNASGDWIVTERADVQAHDTNHPQIVITPNLDHHGSGAWVLTRVQTGFFLLGSFDSLTAARVAADHLAELFPIDDWNVMATLNRPDSLPWRRDRVRAMVRRLPPEERQWLR